MKERTILFQARFPNKVISPVKLFRLYKKSGVKYKNIKIEKKMSSDQEERFEDHRQRIKSKMAHAAANNMPVLYLDEIVFSKTSMIRRAYSSKYVHLTTQQENYYTSYHSAIVTVNTQLGIVHYVILDCAVNE